MSSLYKKEFAWRILFAKLNNRNSSSSKAILNKEQTFCPPSDWWHSTFPSFFFECNALWQLCFVVQVARNFCLTCPVTVKRFQASTRGPSNLMQLRIISTRSQHFLKWKTKTLWMLCSHVIYLIYQQQKFWHSHK